MPKIIVLTDDDRPVWAMGEIKSWHLRSLECPTNSRGSAVASGVRRAVQDAEAIQDGHDPERLSEKVMRLMHEDATRPDP